MDVVFAIHDCALGISPVTSYSGVNRKHFRTSTLATCQEGIRDETMASRGTLDT